MQQPVHGLCTYCVGAKYVVANEAASHVCRVGQNRIYTPYMTVYIVICLPKIPYIHRNIYIYINRNIYIYTEKYIYIHRNIYIYIHRNIYLYIYIFIQRDIYIYIHQNIYIYIYRTDLGSVRSPQKIF